MNFMGRWQVRLLSCLVMRQNFAAETERAINRQITLELQASHDYLAMAYHFDRSDVAQEGAFKFFKTTSEEERGHAEMLMKYLNQRGGKIQLGSLVEPQNEIQNLKEAMQRALEMEKDVNEALLQTHKIAAKHDDPNSCDFIEANFLQEQVDAIKELAGYIKKLEGCESEFEISFFDNYLSRELRRKDKAKTAAHNTQ